MTDIIDPAERPKQRRGFACMDPAKRSEIAKKGGGSVPSHKRSFSVDKTLAMTAGRKGGMAPHKTQHRHHVRKPEEDTVEGE